MIQLASFGSRSVPELPRTPLLTNLKFAEFPFHALGWIEAKVGAGTPRRIPEPSQFVVLLGGLRVIFEGFTICAWERRNWRRWSPTPIG